MNIYDTIYCYDEKDREHKAEITRILQVAKPGSRTKVNCYIDAVVRKTNRNIYIVNGVISLNDWDWSLRPVPPIREGAIVIIDNWEHLCRCRVLGWTKGLSGYRPYSFILEGISEKVKPNQPHVGRIDNFKGHCFTSDTDTVQKIISEGKGRRLIRCPFTTKERQREIFKDRD